MSRIIKRVFLHYLYVNILLIETILTVRNLHIKYWTLRYFKAGLYLEAVSVLPRKLVLILRTHTYWLIFLVERMMEMGSRFEFHIFPNFDFKTEDFKRSRARVHKSRRKNIWPNDLWTIEIYFYTSYTYLSGFIYCYANLKKFLNVKIFNKWNSCIFYFFLLQILDLEDLFRRILFVYYHVWT